MRSGQTGIGGHDGGDAAGHKWGAGRGAVDGDALLVEPRGLHAVAGGGDLELRTGVGERDLLADGVDGAHGDDASIGGGPGELGGLVVAGSGHDQRAAGGGVVDRGVEHVGGRVATERDVDDLGAGIGGGNNATGDGEDVTEAVGRSDADAEDIGCGSDAGCVA